MKQPRKKWQRGSLTIKGPSWFAEWRIYRGEYFTRATQAIGRTEEMSKMEAKKILRELIAKTNNQSFAIDTIAKQLLETAVEPEVNTMFQKKGAISELLVACDFLVKGWDVFRALDPGATCDLVCIKGPETIRVEVKTAQVRLDLRKKVGKFDVLATVDGSSITYTAYHELGNMAKVMIISDGKKEAIA